MRKRMEKAEKHKGKQIAGALIGALCLFLTACSPEQKPGDQADADKELAAYLGQSQQEFNHNVDLSTLSVQVSAGTEATLYMNPDGTILAVHCHDDQAVEVCSGIPMLGMDLESAFFALLTEMTAKGVLEDGMHLEIKIVEEEGVGAGFPLYDVIDSTYQKVKNDTEINVGMSVNADLGNVGAVIRQDETTGIQQPEPGGQQVIDQQQPEPGGQQEVDQQRPDHGENDEQQQEQRPVQDPEQNEISDDQFLEVERDEVGRLVRTLEEDSDGNRIEVYYNEQGQFIKTLITGRDGIYSEIDYKNGLPVHEIHIQPDGLKVEITFREDGTMKERVSVSPQGAIITACYDECERKISMTETHPDGLVITATFYENGSRKTETVREPSGNVIELQFNEQELVVSEKVCHHDGTIEETTFTETGKVLRRVTTYADGRTGESRWFYDTNGTLTGRRDVWSDGQIAEYIYGADERLVSEVHQWTNGQKQEVSFGQNGEQLSCVETYPDGTRTSIHWEYNSNGVRIRETQKNSDGYMGEWVFDSNGLVVSGVETYTDGSRMETEYYTNGNRKSTVIISKDGKSEIWTYTEDGTWGETTTVSGVRRENYDSNGKMIFSSFTSFPSAGLDFTYEEYYFDENGTMLSHKKIQNNGVVGVTTYHYDRSHTTVFTYPQGGGHTEYWYGNNHLGGIDSDGNPWGVMVPGADYSGLSYEGTIGKG